MRGRRLAATVLVVVVALFVVRGVAAGPPAARNLVAPRSGDEEVPEVLTNATGRAVFRLNLSGTALHFQLIVANIEDVTQAHIHLGPRGVNGPVAVFLFGLDPDGVTTNGILSKEAITDDDVISVGVLGTLADLLEEMRMGNTYVNVHTLAHPGGEIRGQIMPAGRP